MKHNLEKKFSSFDLILVLALIAVLIVNIVVSRDLPSPGMKKASKDAVTVTGTAPGKEGDVTVEITADKDNIYSVAVTGQNETPGIGSLAVEQLPAAIVEANSLAVDSVSSATVTSEAIKAAAAAALESAGFDPAAFGFVAPEPEPEVEIAAPVAAEDGKVTATGKGAGIDGDVVVEVVADADKIYEVNILQQNETPGIGSVAVEKLPAAIVEANSIAVDGISGATVTSTAIKTAITEALTSAGFDPANFGAGAAAPAVEPAAAAEPAPAEEPAAAAEPAPAEEPAAADIPEGASTAKAQANGIDGPVVVEVTADADKIYAVNILEQNETPGIGSVAVEKLPAAIVEANSVDIDGITGATVTSTAIKTAVTEALEAIRSGASAEEPAAEPAPAEEAAPVEKETHTGSAALESTVDGKNGPIVVDVVVEDGVITTVDVLQHSETQGVGSVAVDWMPGRIIEANSADVDGVTGATITSDAIKTAVRQALELAANGETAAALAEPVTVQTTVDGRNGPITVEVTTDGVNITDVKVLEHSETQGVGSVAADWMPGRIVEANSTDVDGVTGATVTSDAIKTAVTEALKNAA